MHFWNKHCILFLFFFRCWIKECTAAFNDENSYLILSTSLGSKMNKYIFNAKTPGKKGKE